MQTKKGETSSPREPEDREGESEDQEGDPEEGAQNKEDGKNPERLTRARQVLELATAIAAMVMTLGSALGKLLFERLPKLEPFGVVLVVFFAFLSLSALLQLFLFWRDLATPAARTEFLRTLAFGTFLLGVMVGGMLTRYFWELLQAGSRIVDADPSVLGLPLLVSLMVFYPLWTMVSGATKNFFAIVAAFQNGFFWQTLLSGLKPFSGPVH
jgi:hypothetical protein